LNIRVTERYEELLVVIEFLDNRKVVDNTKFAEVAAINRERFTAAQSLLQEMSGDVQFDGEWAESEAFCVLWLPLSREPEKSDLTLKAAT
jgi:hypothetical protein